MLLNTVVGGVSAVTEHSTQWITTRLMDDSTFFENCNVRLVALQQRVSFLTCWEQTFVSNPAAHNAYIDELGCFPPSRPY